MKKSVLQSKKQLIIIIMLGNVLVRLQNHIKKPPTSVVFYIFKLVTTKTDKVLVFSEL